MSCMVESPFDALSPTWFLFGMCYVSDSFAHVHKNFVLYTTEYIYLLRMFWCPSDVLTTSWLFTARWSTWPGNHLVPCVAELVGYCIPIHAYRGHRYPKCLFYLSGLSLCLSVDHFCLVPVDDMVLFHGMVCDGWLVSVSKKFSYTGLYQLIESIQHWFAHDFSL